VVFFTTNHFSRLSKALIRPGRVDVIVKVGLATVTQARRMFHRFYEELDEAEALADRFAASFLPDSVSMAQLQAYLMNYKEDPHGALRDAPTLLFPATTAAKAAPEL
jgi:chaperone BCS1